MLLFTAERKNDKIWGHRGCLQHLLVQNNRELSSALLLPAPKESFKHHPARPRKVFLAGFSAEMKSRTQKGSGEPQNDQPLSAEWNRFLYFY